MTTKFAPEAPANCPLCPRLVAYREEVAVKEPDWFNGAVPSFGPEDAELLIIGLAPGVTGANRTGRPFTGDWAGDLLYATIDKFGFSTGTYDARPDDGLKLKRAMITNAVCRHRTSRSAPRSISAVPSSPRALRRCRS